jgi:hypothetical protein
VPTTRRVRFAVCRWPIAARPKTDARCTASGRSRPPSASTASPTARGRGTDDGGSGWPTTEPGSSESIRRDRIVSSGRRSSPRSVSDWGPERSRLPLDPSAVGGVIGPAARCAVRTVARPAQRVLGPRRAMFFFLSGWKLDRRMPACGLTVCDRSKPQTCRLCDAAIKRSQCKHTEFTRRSALSDMHGQQWID